VALLALVMAPGPEPPAIDEVAIFPDFRKPLTPLATVFPDFPVTVAVPAEVAVPAGAGAGAGELAPLRTGADERFDTVALFIAAVTDTAGPDESARGRS